MSGVRAKACAAFGDQLTAYLDGALPDDRLSAVRGHLRECAGCRHAADELAIVRDGLRELAPVEPPTTLWAGVQAQLALRARSKIRIARGGGAIARWLPALPQFGGVAIACAAAAVLLWWKAAHRGDDAPTPAQIAATQAAGATTTAPTPDSHAQVLASAVVPVCPPPGARRGARRRHRR